jgi:transposase-like protein
MSDSAEDLGAKKEAAILALLSSRNVEEAARASDVDPRTLYRWLKEPAFSAAYREARRATFSQAISRLHQMAGAAVSTLGKVMVDPNTPASTRVRAADSVLGHAAKAIELEDIEVRVAELERAAQTSKRGWR